MKFSFKITEFILEKRKNHELLNHLFKKYDAEIMDKDVKNINFASFYSILRTTIYCVKTNKNILNFCDNCGYPTNREDLKYSTYKDGFIFRKEIKKGRCKCCEKLINEKTTELPSIFNIFR